MLKLFRVIAFFEGISYILLLFIAVPIKYVFDDPTYVKMLGMPHGVLFMIYIIFSFIVNIKLKWNMNCSNYEMKEQGVLTKPFHYEITTTKGLLTGSKHMSYQ